jgi:hypothetical protein
VVCHSREVRAVPRWLLRDYLVEAGGKAKGDDLVQGDGWTARLTVLEDYRVGNLRVGQVRLELRGSAEALAGIEAILEPKLLRGGG